MSSRSPKFERLRRRVGRTARRFQTDARGAAGVEFALVVVPFLLMAMGIITIGMHYLVVNFLEHGVEVAARQLRTGEAQKGGVTAGQFRQLVCDAAGPLIACDERLVVHVKSRATFADLMPITPCITNGRLTPAEGEADDAISTQAGDASQAVLVNICYEWDAGFGLWQRIWTLLAAERVDRGNPILSAATAFRSEPFQ